MRNGVFFLGGKVPRYHSLNFLTASLYRLAGMQIGRGSRVVGLIEVEMSISHETISGITIGENCFVNSGVRMSTRNCAISIGNDVLIGPRVSLETSSHSLLFDLPNGRGTTDRPIIIGDRVWIAAGATILPGITVGTGAVVAAGAVVTKDVAALTVVGGVPARLIRRLNCDLDSLSDRPISSAP